MKNNLAIWSHWLERCHSSVDPSALTKPSVLCSNPKDTIYPFSIDKFEIKTLLLEMRKERKYAKRGRDWSIRHD